MITLKYLDQLQGPLNPVGEELQSLVAQLNAILKLNADAAIELSAIGSTGGGSTAVAVRSIQYGTITINAGGSSGTASITAVTQAKTALHYLGATTTAATAFNDAMVRITLTSSTVVTATRGDTGDDVTVGFCAVEFV